MFRTSLKTVTVSLLLLGATACTTNGINAAGENGPMAISHSYAPLLTEANEAYSEGRFSSAETYFLQYIKAHPDYTDGWFKLGNIYYRTGQYPAAITAYENVLQQNSKHGKAWHNIALTRLKQAEAILVKGESLFIAGTRERQRLTELKKRIRASVRQYPTRQDRSKPTDINVESLLPKTHSEQTPSREQRPKTENTRYLEQND